MAQAEQEAGAAQERYQRVQRAFQDGVIESVHRAERPGLMAEREAAEAAVARAREHAREVANAAPLLDAEAELLRHVGDLRAAVLEGIGDAPNLDATRTVLRRLFSRFFYLADGHLWLKMDGFIDDDMPRVAASYLMPSLNEGVVERVDENGLPYFIDEDPSCRVTPPRQRLRGMPALRGQSVRGLRPRTSPSPTRS